MVLRLIVDLHSHLGVLSTPILGGASFCADCPRTLADGFMIILGAVDLNSAKGPIVPYLRSIDGLNTHDAGYQLAIAGGVTTVQVLPGSINAMGWSSHPT